MEDESTYRVARDEALKRTAREIRALQERMWADMAEVGRTIADAKQKRADYPDAFDGCL